MSWYIWTDGISYRRRDNGEWVGPPVAQSEVPRAEAWQWPEVTADFPDAGTESESWQSLELTSPQQSPAGSQDETAHAGARIGRPGMKDIIKAATGRGTEPISIFITANSIMLLANNGILTTVPTNTRGSVHNRADQFDANDLLRAARFVVGNSNKAAFDISMFDWGMTILHLPERQSSPGRKICLPFRAKEESNTND